MKNNLSCCSIALAISLVFSTYAQSKDERTSVMRATTSQDCECKHENFGDSVGPRLVKKGQIVGLACVDNEKENTVSCEEDFSNRIICPKDCLRLWTQGRLNRGELKTAVDDFVKKDAAPLFQKKVPRVIVEKLTQKYPSFLPVVYNRHGPFIAQFQSLDPFYFEVPLKIQGKVQTVSIVYFFQDLDHLLASNANWSFWLTASGELLYDSLAPYKVYDHAGVQRPCLAPAGFNLDQIVLSGIAMGESDAGPCCGPYSLSFLKEKGPVKIDENRKDLFDHEVIYHLCSRSTDPATGRYAPTGLYEIDGPANLRKRHEVGSFKANNAEYIPPPAPSEKSEIIGSCADHSKVADLGSIGEWHHVYCEGKNGYTHKKNIRGLVE